MNRRSNLFLRRNHVKKSIGPRRRRYFLEKLEERAMLAYNVTLSSIVAIDEGESAALAGEVGGLQEFIDYRVDINWGDGSAIEGITFTGDGSDSRPISGSHTYADDGEYIVVVDLWEFSDFPENDFVHAAQAGTEAVVDNVAPTLSNIALSGSSTILEGESVILSGNISDPGVEDTFTLTVNWGDGSTEVINYPAGTTAFNATHQYQDDNPTNTAADVNNVVPVIADDDGGIAALSGGGGGAQPAYFPFGPQNNVEESDLSGWEVCWSSLYGFSFDNGEMYTPNVDDPFAPVHGDPLSDVFGPGRCSGNYLLVAAGRFPGDEPYVLDVVAAAPREDVLTDTGTGDAVHIANGVNWYFDENSAMGYTAQGTTIARIGGGCDVEVFNAADRLCWHTREDQIIGGYRDGAMVGLDAGNGFDHARFIYQEVSGPVVGLSVTVENVAPEVTDLSTSVTPCTNLVSLTGAFSDAGLMDTHTVAIDWGDGSSGSATVDESNGTGSFESSHSYATSGNYEITVTVADDDLEQDIEATSTTAHVSGVSLDTSGTLQVSGTNAAESIVVRKVNSGTQIRVTVNDTNVSQFAAGDVEAIEIRTCGGNDAVRIGANLGDSGSESEGDVSNAVFIDGGAGDDHLIGGPGDDTIFGGPGKDLIRGRDGDDALLGGDNDDQLFGGNGEDLLVGGNGEDDLRGNDDGDLLIGGFTSFDSNKSAVSLIMQEWTSGQSYLIRVVHLVSGTGSVLSGTGVALVSAGPSRTIFDDNVRDTLRGQDGRDWFFADLNDDRVKDDVWNELIIPI